jgi:hypothetical protein
MTALSRARLTVRLLIEVPDKEISRSANEDLVPSSENAWSLIPLTAQIAIWSGKREAFAAAANM